MEEAEQKKGTKEEKSFGALIIKYKRLGHDTKASLKLAYEEFYPDPIKGCFLYLMSSFPEGTELKPYKNGYILVGNELKYVMSNGKYEENDVPIKEMERFLEELGEIEPIYIKKHLSLEQIEDIITSNGGHVPKRRSKKDTKKKEIDKETKEEVTNERTEVKKDKPKKRGNNHAISQRRKSA